MYIKMYSILYSMLFLLMLCVSCVHTGETLETRDQRALRSGCLPVGASKFARESRVLSLSQAHTNGEIIKVMDMQ